MTDRVVVLGGCGGIGSVAVRALVAGDRFDEIVVADLRVDAAQAFVDSLGDPRLQAAEVDATSADAIGALVAGATVVVNCIGPFYKFGPPILAAVIAAGVDYVDVCDDLDATIAMLDQHEPAVAAGVTALIGMGNSPGLANVLVRFAADELLDTVERVDIMHIHGGEPSEGGAVIKHRIHAMTNDVPVYVDGEFRNVRLLEESGQEFVVDTHFESVGTYPVYPYPHPETITLPKYLPGLKHATNRGVVFPLSYFELTMDMVRVGACTTDPIEVQGEPVTPIEFSVAHILSQRDRLLAEAGITGAAGCLKIEVGGQKDGEDHAFVFSLSSTSVGAGEGTGIPAALGAVMMASGQLEGPGVFPPEAVVKPLEILDLASTIVPKLGIAGSDDGGALPVLIEHILPDGTRERMDLAF